MRPAAVIASFCLTALLCPLAAQEKKAAPKPKSKAKPAAPAPAQPSPWSDWVEPDFPFFSSVLDARDVGDGFPKDNLTPRGLILNLGHNLWACFDVDLLRIACIWEGEPGKPPVTPEALAPGSYHIAGQKTKDGQEYLPKPVGKVLLVNGVYPGIQLGGQPKFSDPRRPSESEEEVGRGPLDGSRFLSVRRATRGVILEYEIAGVSIEQLIEASDLLGADGERAVITRFSIAPSAQPLSVTLCQKRAEVAAVRDPKSAIGIGIATTSMDVQELRFPTPDGGQYQSMIVPAHEKPIEFWLSTQTSVLDSRLGSWEAHQITSDPRTREPAPSTWPQTLATQAALSKAPDAYVIDDIPLPVPNPWKRNVRLADIAFLNDKGEAAAVSFDGDVWLISGLTGDLEKVTWQRFASGLHEPMSIVSREGEIFVFDRNGIWKLVDTNGDQEADRYEMFCNLFAQTAETREFPNSMKLGPDGSFYISKGGQEGTTRGKHNGTVIRVAPDGKSIEVVGYGLRQPFIGVNPETGMVTASDQQGNYVPSTPIQIVEKGQFYGHLPTIAPKEQYPAPITEPMVWLPHPVNPSGATQTWLLGAKMGPVNGELIHVGYNRPELFRVLINNRFKRPQATVMSFSRDFDFGPLNAHVNPADGQLYVVGFQVWGTTAKKLSGLVRLRYTDKPRVLLKEVTPTDKGLILRFNAKLDPKLATDPSSYSAERWNYKRTFDYGSPHLKLDGSTGQEWLTPSSAYLSEDGHSVLVGIPDMKAGVHQMRIGWGLRSAEGLKAENTAYLSPWELATFDSQKEGFGKIEVDLTPRAATTVAMAEPTVEEGARLYQMIGCMACHSIDGTTVGKVGPSWKGIYGTERESNKGQKGKFIADENYLRESIVNPSAKVVKGFEKFDTGMPIYAGILNDSQIESLVMYIKSLK